MDTNVSVAKVTYLHDHAAVVMQLQQNLFYGALSD